MYSFSFRVPGGSSSSGERPSVNASRVSTSKVAARLALCLGAVAPFLSVPAHAAGVSTAVTSSDYAPGELLVKFKDGPSSARAAQVLNQIGATPKKSFSTIGWQSVKLPAGTTTLKGMQKIAALSGVVAVEPNYRIYPMATPNDPGFGGQYHHSLIRSPQAWDVQKGGSDVIVAVLDTGVYLDHPDLKDHLFVNTKEADNDLDDDGSGKADDFQGWDFADNDNNPDDDGADPGHGTHCAGLVGAIGDNGVGVTGVDWNTTILPLRVLGDEGGTLEAQIGAYEYMIKMKQIGNNIRIASCSFGGTGRSAAAQDAIVRAGQAGILTIAAAGNGNDRGVGSNNDVSPVYPAAFETPYVLTVAASDQNDMPTTFTNYGASTVDIAAPGQDILSTWVERPAPLQPYNSISGTSMACPIVSGAAALVLSQHPEYGPIDLKNRLMDTVDKLPQWKGKVASGGRLNVANAVGGIFKLSGTVYALDETDTRVPLEGATVLISATGKSATTDDEGKYELTDLASGNYTVTVSLLGYQSKTRTIAVTGGDVTADFELEASPATYSITGRVTTFVNGSEVGLEGVSIYLNGSSDPSATTNSNGDYIIADRGAGSYTVTAFKDRYTITAKDETPATLDLPTGEGSGVVNFEAVSDGPDITPPVVTIDTPADGSIVTFSSGSNVAITAIGSATDETGIANLYFILARQNGKKLQYYNWKKKSWVANAANADVVMTRNVSGLKEMSWSLALPKLAKGSYILTASGRDTLGNTSDGSQDAISAFTVAKATKSNNKAASAPQS